MRDLLPPLFEALRASRHVAVCRLVETRGSTPQKAGAAMLAFADGSQSGTLGGGCVEAEVKRRALAALPAGAAQIATFQLDSDYGWDDGLICGGRMQVLIEPLRSIDDAKYFERLADLFARSAGCVEAIVFDAEKSRLAPGACFLFDERLQLVAARGPDDFCPAEAPALVRDGLPDLSLRPRNFALQGVSYLTNLPRCRLLIVGGGHVGQAVGNWAADLDFDVWAIDDRAEYVSRERFPRAARRIVARDLKRDLAAIEITPDTYCLIVTRGHQHDEEALEQLFDRGARYVGMIGSKRKIKLIFDDLIAAGASPDALSRVYAPVGLEIGSQTVPEIAVSILAELISHRNLNGAVPGKLTACEI